MTASGGLKRRGWLSTAAAALGAPEPFDPTTLKPFTWDSSYFTDGVHPAPKARDIFVRKCWEFLKADPVPGVWLPRP